MVYVTGGTLFEELGLLPYGPDRRSFNFDHLLPVLQQCARQRQRSSGARSMSSPRRARAIAPAEAAADKYHGVNKFDVITGAQKPSAKPNAPAYTAVFADSAGRGSRSHDEKIIGDHRRHAVNGTGLDQASRSVFPER
jgi:1-deoxy-D-xylulose-5-phosphate synthase